MSALVRLGKPLAGLFVFVLIASADYVVKPGDTLWKIAQEQKVSTRSLIDANALVNPDHIEVGQRLVIPGQAAVTHVIQPGETLSAIARRYGITAKALVEVNQIKNPDRILAGAGLSIPAVASAPPLTTTPPPAAPASTAPAMAAAAPAPVAPPPGASPPAPVAPTQPATSHVIRSGETLSEIAKQYGTSVRLLRELNGLDSIDSIRAGASLVIPGPEVAAAPPGPTGRQHVVAPGENLASIAAAYGTTLQALVTLNKVADPNQVQPGMLLAVPPNAAFTCPVDGAWFADDWHVPRPDGRLHMGTDLFAPKGTPVLASVAGSVEHAEGAVGGLQFHLRGDDGTRYFGSHLSAFGSNGRVGAGEVVGFVGDTGNAQGTSPHLHFEIHPGGGEAVDPYPTLAANCSRP